MAPVTIGLGTVKLLYLTGILMSDGSEGACR